MKRNRVMYWALSALLLVSLLAGCAKKQDAGAPETPAASAAPEAQPKSEAGGVDAAQPKSDAPDASDTSKPDAAAPDASENPIVSAAADVYAPILDATCDVLHNGVGEMWDENVPSGVSEMSQWMERDELLQRVGYCIEDISGDGVPELLIGMIPDETAEVTERGVVFGGYTCRGGEAVCFLDGWARSAYSYLGDGRFYYFGSGGAAYSAFGTYRISIDGTELVCEDFYFSDVEGDDYSELAYYHNTSGEWDKTAAERVDLPEGEFWSLSDSLEEACEAPNLLPFADYPYTQG